MNKSTIIKMRVAHDNFYLLWPSLLKRLDIPVIAYQS